MQVQRIAKTCLLYNHYQVKVTVDAGLRESLQAPPRQGHLGQQEPKPMQRAVQTGGGINVWGREAAWDKAVESQARASPHQELLEPQLWTLASRGSSWEDRTGADGCPAGQGLKDAGRCCICAENNGIAAAQHTKPTAQTDGHHRELCRNSYDVQVSTKNLQKMQLVNMANASLLLHTLDAHNQTIFRTRSCVGTPHKPEDRQQSPFSHFPRRNTVSDILTPCRQAKRWAQNFIAFSDQLSGTHHIVL